MNTKSLALGFSLLFSLIFLFHQSAAAQTVYQETTIEGEIYYADHPDFEGFNGTLETPLTFTVLITEDLTNPQLSSGPNGGYNSFQTTTAYEFWLYDEQGIEILYDRVDLRDIDTTLVERVAIYHDSNASFPESAMWGIIASKTGRTEYALGSNTFGSRISPPGPETSPLVATVSPYPKLTTGTLVHPFQATADERPSGPNFRFEGAALYISYEGPRADTDGDGTLDSADSCVTSLLDETVLFDGWLDSGVTNYLDDSGCTIMDRYAACEAEAEEEEQPSSPWGWFQPVSSGPSYCETQVVYGLQRERVIDYTEGRMLRNALSLSSRSGGPS